MFIPISWCSNGWCPPTAWNTLGGNLTLGPWLCPESDPDHGDYRCASNPHSTQRCCGEKQKTNNSTHLYSRAFESGEEHNFWEGQFILLCYKPKSLLHISRNPINMLSSSASFSRHHLRTYLMGGWLSLLGLPRTWYNREKIGPSGLKWQVTQFSQGPCLCLQSLGICISQLGLCNKAPQIYSLTVWSLRVWDPVVGRVGFAWGLSPWCVDGCILSVFSHSLSSVYVCVLISFFFN